MSTLALHTPICTCALSIYWLPIDAITKAFARVWCSLCLFKMPQAIENPAECCHSFSKCKRCERSWKISKVYRDNSMNAEMVKKMGRFKDGHTSATDEVRNGRSYFIHDGLAQKVDEIVRKNRRFTIWITYEILKRYP